MHFKIIGDEYSQKVACISNVPKLRYYQAAAHSGVVDYSIEKMWLNNLVDVYMIFIIFLMI